MKLSNGSHIDTFERFITLIKSSEMTEKYDGTSAITSGELGLQEGHRISYTSIGDEHHPLLLFVVGSSGLGYLYHRLALELSPKFRCVYYDKRGFLPRTTDHNVAANQKNPLVLVEQHADDAAALIRLLSSGKPAYVFGTSTGGAAVLDMTARHPSLVHLAILHEPITFSVVRDSQLRNEMIALYWMIGNMTDPLKSLPMHDEYMYKLSNAKPAVARTFKKHTTSPNAVDIYNALQGHQEAIAMARYVVDEKRAQAASEKLVVVCGKESANLRVNMPGKALSEVLGKGHMRELPGDHASFANKTNAAAFSKQLLSILTDGCQLLPSEVKRTAKL